MGSVGPARTYFELSWRHAIRPHVTENTLAGSYGALYAPPTGPEAKQAESSSRIRSDIEHSETY